MRSNRDLAQDVLAELLEVTSAEKILDYLVVNYLSGTTALQGLQEYKSELFGDDEEEEDELEDQYEVCTFDSEEAVAEVYEGGLSYQRALVVAMQLFDDGKFFGVQVVSNLPEDELDPIVWIRTKQVDGSSWRDSEDFFDDEEEVELEVGMEVEVILKGDACINEVGDIGTIIMIDDQGSFRVSVDGRDGPNNWMNASQVARINY